MKYSFKSVNDLGPLYALFVCCIEACKTFSLSG